MEANRLPFRRQPPVVYLSKAVILDTSASYNWWGREGFFAVGSGLKERGILVDNR